MASFLDIVQQIGGWAGTAGAGIAGEVYRRFRTAERSAKTALAKAIQLEKKFEVLRNELESIEEKFEATRKGLALDLANFKEDIARRLGNLEENYERDKERASDSEIMGTAEVTRQIKQLHKQNDELRGDLLRERGQRHALQQEFNEYIRGEAKWQQALNRALGKMEGILGVTKE